jgi:hypothetical protein
MSVHTFNLKATSPVAFRIFDGVLSRGERSAPLLVQDSILNTSGVNAMAADAVDPFDSPSPLPADADTPQEERGELTTPTPPAAIQPVLNLGGGSFGPTPRGGSSGPSF